jgi:photosystem II stability/assembly factor-like uncharacterized protein
MFAPALAAAVVLAAPLVLAGANATAAATPFGWVSAVAVSPSSGRVLVGVGDNPGRCLWWSDDHGAHWQVARGLAKASAVSALAFSSSRPNVVYAGVSWSPPDGFATGFLVSTDGGESWQWEMWQQQVSVFGGKLPARIDALVVDPKDSATVYADTHGALRRTRDGGKTWAPARAGLPPAGKTGGPGEVALSAELDQQVAADLGGTLYYSSFLAKGTGQIYRSTDRGSSWRRAGFGLPSDRGRAYVLDLASDLAGAAGAVYAAGSRGVWTTRDAGRSWTRTLRSRATSVHVARGTVFVGAYGALWRRVGQGRWTRRAFVGADDYAVDATTPTRLYGWAWQQDDPKEMYCAQLWSSSDGGATWRSLVAGLPLARQKCIR